MPEKSYGRCAMRCRGCLRCWANKMKHGSKQTKAYIAKHGLPADFTPPILGDRVEDLDREMVEAKYARKDEVQAVLQRKKGRQMERKSQRAARAAERREAALDAELLHLQQQMQARQQETPA